MQSPHWKWFVLVGLVALITIVHHALMIQTTSWAISASMGEGARHSGILSSLAVALSWPVEGFLSSPVQRMEHGWILAWVNSLIWGLGLTIIAWAAIRSLNGERDSDNLVRT